MILIMCLLGALLLMAVILLQDRAIRRQRKSDRANMRRLMSYLENRRVT